MKILEQRAEKQKRQRKNPRPSEKKRNTPRTSLMHKTPLGPSELLYHKHRPSLMSPTRPPFSSLPLDPNGPHGNAWGLWGNADQLGMLNLLTPSNTTLAAKEIFHGTRISVDWPLNKMSPPCFNRVAFNHNIINKAPRSVNDDTVAFNTQSSSQWDGFRHYGYQKEKRYYNDCTNEDVLGSEKNGIHVWVENGGVVGRGVLLDYKSWAEERGEWSVDACFQTTPITVDVLEQVAQAQGVQFKEGDILLIRTGWTNAYEQLSTEARTKLSETYPPPAIGVESSEKTVRWMWEKGFAAVAGDQPSFEAWPCQNTEYLLHEWLLAGWGLPIGEIFDLDKLAKECKDKNKWSFFFSSMPIHVPGGVASPPNGVAIL
jgi:kynurenine formamidase